MSESEQTTTVCSNMRCPGRVPLPLPEGVLLPFCQPCTEQAALVAESREVAKP